MRILLLLFLLLLISVASVCGQTVSGDGSNVVVLGSKWAKSRQIIEPLNPSTSAVVPPAQAMIPQNKNFQRNAREQTSPGMRDPNLDTLDGRQAALEKNVLDSRTPQPQPVDGYTYKAKIQNASKKVIEIIFWEYQFKESANPETVTRRQFLCAVNIKPDKEKELQAFSVAAPSGVISTSSLANKSGEKLFEEKIIINRVEYADGTIWQRRDWNFGEIKATFERAVATPWSAEMCRGL
ncbi:MAG TPA: hypothetical protein VF779_10615 [Pyrinomonadaceae bacterium]